MANFTNEVYDTLNTAGSLDGLVPLGPYEGDWVSTGLLVTRLVDLHEPVSPACKEHPGWLYPVLIFALVVLALLMSCLVGCIAGWLWWNRKTEDTEKRRRRSTHTSIKLHRSPGKRFTEMHHLPAEPAASGSVSSSTRALTSVQQQLYRRLKEDTRFSDLVSVPSDRELEQPPEQDPSTAAAAPSWRAAKGSNLYSVVGSSPSPSCGGRHASRVAITPGNSLCARLSLTPETPECNNCDENANEDAVHRDAAGGKLGTTASGAGAAGSSRRPNDGAVAAAEEDIAAAAAAGNAASVPTTNTSSLLRPSGGTRVKGYSGSKRSLGRVASSRLGSSGSCRLPSIAQSASSRLSRDGESDLAAADAAADANSHIELGDGSMIGAVAVAAEALAAATAAVGGKSSRNGSTAAGVVDSTCGTATASAPSAPPEAAAAAAPGDAGGERPSSAADDRCICLAGEAGGASTSAPATVPGDSSRNSNNARAPAGISGLPAGSTDDDATGTTTTTTTTTTTAVTRFSGFTAATSTVLPDTAILALGGSNTRSVGLSGAEPTDDERIVLAARRFGSVGPAAGAGGAAGAGAVGITPRGIIVTLPGSRFSGCKPGGAGAAGAGVGLFAATAGDRDASSSTAVDDQNGDDNGADGDSVVSRYVMRRASARPSGGQAAGVAVCGDIGSRRRNTLVIAGDGPSGGSVAEEEETTGKLALCGASSIAASDGSAAAAAAGDEDPAAAGRCQRDKDEDENDAVGGVRARSPQLGCGGGGKMDAPATAEEAATAGDVAVIGDRDGANRDDAAGGEEQPAGDDHTMSPKMRWMSAVGAALGTTAGASAAAGACVLPMLSRSTSQTRRPITIPISSPRPGLQRDSGSTLRTIAEVTRELKRIPWGSKSSRSLKFEATTSLGAGDRRSGAGDEAGGDA